MMVLRSGIIIPFQFRDTKKLLMIGVPEENRDLSIWDLKNVVRAAFGIYNFEFRNKKIGFNIPDELLLNYLAQRHDLTNFVIEVGQVFSPAASNSNCATCRCLPLPADAEEKTLAVSPMPHGSHAFMNHNSNSSFIKNANKSPNNVADQPPYKIRRPLHPHNSNSIDTGSNLSHNPPEMLRMEPLVVHDDDAQSDDDRTFSHMQIEPKIDYDSIDEVPESAAQALRDAAVAAVAAATASSTSASEYRGDEQSPELHFERMKMEHEFYMQQQQQHHHQQQQQQQQQHQQQLQQHMDAMMQESAGGNTLRQRKERMSKKQKEIFVNFLEQTPIFSEYKRNDPILDIYWQKLTDILNSVPQGAVKSMSEWKQAFDNWRFRIYVYARYNSKVTGDEALNPKNFKPLTVTDKRAYALWIRNPDTAPPDLDNMRNIFMNLDETQHE